MNKKRINKKFLVVLCLFAIANIFALTVAANSSAPSKFVVDGSVLQEINVKKYITNAPNSLLQKFKKTTDNKVIYCLDIDKYAVDKGVKATYEKGKELDPRYVYILENGFPSKKITGDDEQDYFITNLAVWYTRAPEKMSQFDLKGGKYSGEESYSIKKMAELVNGSKNYKTVNPTISISDTEGGKMIRVGDYYESQFITVKKTGNVQKYKIVGLPEGSSTLDESLTEKNEFSTGERFKIKVPASAINNLNFDVKIEANGIINKAYLYTTKDKGVHGTFQDTVAMYPDTVVLNASTTLTIDKITEISKIDATSGKELPGAHLVITDSTGKKITEFTSTNEKHIIKNLNPGKYYLTETIAPKGYELSKEKVEFDIKNDLTVVKAIMKNHLKKVPISISKQDITTKEELPGAHLEIHDANDMIIEKFVSGNKPYIIENGLKPGKYYLIETIAPDGYELSKERIEFTVNDDGTVDKTVVMYNKMEVKIEVPISISKKDITTKEELPGAHLQLHDANGKLIIEFTSTDKPHVISKGLEPGKYTLTETIAPDGYELTKEKVEFVVKEDGTVDKPVVMYNKKIVPISISKEDITTKEEVPGAHLQLHDANGKLVVEFTSTDKPFIIEEGLKPGKYTLTETMAPKGYILTNETIEFIVNKDGTVDKPIVMYNKKIVPILISKKDITTKEEVPGAHLEIHDINDKLIIEFVSGDKPYVIEDGLKPGKYYLIETVAPKGYELTKEKVEFIVKEDGTVDKTVVMFNKLETKIEVPITISKQDIATKEELPGAHLEIHNDNNELILKFVSGERPYVIKEGLKPGKYTLIETIAPDGYELSKEKVEFVVNEDGTTDKKIVMYNKPVTEIKVPPTGTYKTMIAAVVGTIIACLGFGLIYKNLKKNEKH